MKHRVITATFWAVLETGGAQGLAFLFFVLFARLLTQEEFGAYALAMAIVGAVNIVLFQGFGDALIQAERLDESYVSTAFWTNMMMALAMVVILQILALFAPVLFGEPILRPVIASLSLLCIPRALVSVHSALFRRSLDLRVFAIRTIVGSVVGNMVGLGLALAGFGIWALVISQFVQSILIVIIMWTSTEWRPRAVFSKPAFSDLFQFSKHFMFASIISSCIDDFGNIIIGLELDIVSVAYYSIALRILRSIITLSMTPLQLVMMPALSRVAQDCRKFGATYSDMVLMTSTIWLPIVLGLGLAAPDLVPAAFGPQWVGAVKVVQAMSFAAFTMPLWAFSGQALSALGRPDAFARVALWQVGLYIAVLPITAYFGVVAAGWAWSALSAMMVPVAMVRLHKLSGLDVGALMASQLRLALAGGALMATMLIARALLPPGIGPMVLELALGAAVYAIILDKLLIPGHLTRIVMLARGSIPALSS
jgi:O-antigen/teichoic acid export membrane protein